MNFSVDRCVLNEVYVGEGGVQYATFSSASGPFKLSAPKNGFDFTKLPTIEPMSLEATIKGRQFGNSFSFEVVAVTPKVFNRQPAK